LPLPSDGLIQSLDYLPTEQVPKIPLLKRTIVDVKCTDQRGHIFIVEMQLEWTSFFMKRLLFGASQAYVNQLGKGEEYAYLKPVYGLGLLAENFDKGPEFYHHYKIVNVKNSNRELEGLQFVFIELQKFKPNNHEQRRLQVLWLRFFSEINEKTRVVDPALMAIPEIRQAIELSEESAYTAAELNVYNTYWDAVSTEKTLLTERFEMGLLQGEAKGEAKGKAQGLVEGEAKGLSKALRLILQTKFNTIPHQYHEKIESATDSLIQQWLERVLKASTIEDVFYTDHPYSS